MKFDGFYTNDGTDEERCRIEHILLCEMSDGGTRVINGHAVTRWHDEAFEVGTWGVEGNTFGVETVSEGLSSSDYRNG